MRGDPFGIAAGVNATDLRLVQVKYQIKAANPLKSLVSPSNAFRWKSLHVVDTQQKANHLDWQKGTPDLIISTLRCSYKRP